MTEPEIVTSHSPYYRSKDGKMKLYAKKPNGDTVTVEKTVPEVIQELPDKIAQKTLVKAILQSNGEIYREGDEIIWEAGIDGLAVKYEIVDTESREAKEDEDAEGEVEVREIVSTMGLIQYNGQNKFEIETDSNREEKIYSMICKWVRRNSDTAPLF